MKLRIGFALVCAAAIIAAGANRAWAGVITQWTFPTVTPAPFNSPAPDVGSGTATVLGMNNGYTFSSGNTITGTGTFTFTTLYSVGSVAAADVLATPGDPNGFANTWRVRGPNNSPNQPPGNGNGWALQAPQYTQGAQFSAGTSGNSGVTFHADWFTTTQGVKNLQPQYTTNGTTWNNIGPLLTAVSNGWEQINLDFSAVPGAANDPSFGVRLVSAYDPTLSPLNYGSADGGQNGVYNNNSGNWRFTDVTFSGSLVSAAAVPEPSSLLLCAVAGALGLVRCRRRKPRQTAA